MDITRRPRRTDSDSLAKGPLEPYFDAFKQYLAQHGYAAQTSGSYVADISHFARWARIKRLRLNRVNEASIAEFLDEHLPVTDRHIGSSL
jgi:site-specific recombinase XerD